MYEETLFADNCATRAKSLTIIMGQRKCSKRYTNFHRLRGTWCDKGDDGEADPTGIGAMNCMHELQKVKLCQKHGDNLCF